MTSPMTVAALALALVYCLLAAGFIRADRQTHTGGFINLQGMISLLVTLPVSWPVECWGRKLNFRSNGQMTGAVVFCGGLVFGASYGAIRLVASIR